ncbi:LysR family transcriptional regulator [Proteiniborus sp.]|uniref:LysR family transcriptional regulator n=1 Tax=Proteiniborus sp. TaxID=2079015 RepID=UPI00332F52C3
MNYNILRYIIAVAEERNFTKAAKKLYIAQPSLSQIIRSEEEKLGILLFDRSCSPIALTDAGHEYVRWARQVVSIQENMERRLQDYSVNEVSVLRIGILPECSAFILPDPLKAFRETNPKRYVQIRELSSNDLQNSLENSEMDFIVGLTHPDTFKYCSEPLYDEQIVLAVTPDFSPADKTVKEVDLADFADAPFVMMEEGQFLYNMTHELCKRCGFVPKAVVECYNLETAMHMVKAGVGIALIPDLMSCLVEGLHYYNIKGLTPESQISVVYPRNRYLTREARELIELIKSNAKK